MLIRVLMMTHDPDYCDPPLRGYPPLHPRLHHLSPLYQILRQEVGPSSALEHLACLQPDARRT